MKIGGAVNRVVSAGLWGFCTPFCAGAFAPEYIRTVLAGYGPLLNTLFPLLPTQLKSDADVLNLPVYNQGASIFSGVGVGSVSTPAPYDHDQNKASTQYRAYIQDTWKIRPNLTVNFGLAWNAQTGFYNSDLPKPAFLKPIVGADNGPTVNNTKEFQPAFGFAWSPGKNSKTVIRGGAGLYWDSTPVYYKLREAPVIGPVGDGRSTLTASAFTNDIPGISIVGAALTPIGVGTPLPLGVITTMTVGQFAALVARQLPAVAARLTPTPPTSGPYTTTGIDVAKQGVEIYPSHFPLARSYQTSIGFQRDLGHGMLIQADYAMRLAINSSMGELDYNLFNRFLGTPTPAPVIPQCTAAQALIVSAQCSTGSITFWTDQGRAIYNGLLTKFTKRGKKYNVLVSYAFQKASANTVNVWNQVNWGSNYGQYLEHNNITIAGTWNLPLGFQITANSSYVGAAPATVSVSGLIMPGTVASGGSEPLPTLQLGCANISCGQPELADAVSRFNSTIAGTKDAKGATIAPLTLPTGNYSFGQGTMSQDFRLTKNFTFKEQYKLGVFVEMFNTFNVSNLTGFPLTINAAGFGQPTGRTAQTFGSGGQ